MRITLDTENKTIEIEEQVNLKDLTDELDKLFPDGSWKEYTLKMGVSKQIDLSPVQPFIRPYDNTPWTQPYQPITPSPNYEPNKPIWLYDPYSSPIYTISTYTAQYTDNMVLN